MQKENKKLLLSGIGLGLIVAIYQIRRIKNIDIKIQNADIIKLSFKQISVNLNLAINNTSNLTATIADYSYSVKFNGKSILENSAIINKEIAPAQKTIIPIKIDFKPMNLIKSIGKGLMNKNMVLDVDVNVNAKVLHFNWPFKINYKLKV